MYTKGQILYCLVFRSISVTQKSNKTELLSVLKYFYFYRVIFYEFEILFMNYFSLNFNFT